MSDDDYLKKRRVPRRSFEHNIGLLVRGQYVISRAHQIGEGGMMVSSPYLLATDQKVVVTFKLPGVSPNVVLARVRYQLPQNSLDKEGTHRYGIEFMNLGFMERREVRNYVAEKSMEEFLAMAEMEANQRQAN